MKELERIVEERQDWLFRFAYMRIGIREDAEDVVQEVLLSVFRRLCEKTSMDNREDDEYLPFDWKRLKEKVNDKEVLYGDWWD